MNCVNEICCVISIPLYFAFNLNLPESDKDLNDLMLSPLSRASTNVECAEVSYADAANAIIDRAMQDTGIFSLDQVQLVSDLHCVTSVIGLCYGCQCCMSLFCLS